APLLCLLLFRAALEDDRDQPADNCAGRSRLGHVSTAFLRRLIGLEGLHAGDGSADEPSDQYSLDDLAHTPLLRARAVNKSLTTGSFAETRKRPGEGASARACPSGGRGWGSPSRARHRGRCRPCPR